jgi:hypothetical protein
MKFPFVGGAYTGRSAYVNAQTCRNLMVEFDPTTTDGKVLVGTPGYTLVSASPGTLVRHINNDYIRAQVLYCIVDNELYSYGLSSGTWTALSTVGGNTWDFAGFAGSPVSSASMGLASDQTALAFAAFDSILNVYNTTGPTATRVQIGGVNQKASTVCFLDGRFIADDFNNPGRFIYSDLLDPTVWNPFNFATAEGAPDTVRAVFANRRELYLFGDRSIEVWYSTGDANSPFARYQGGFIETGLAATYTVAECDNTIMWLATDKKGQVYVAAMGPNYQPMVISPPGINYRLQSISKGISGIDFQRQSYATVYRLGGHEVYVLTVYVDNSTTEVTFCFDASTKEWHEWGAGTSGPHPIQHAASAQAKVTNHGTYICLTNSGSLFRLANDVYTDNGAAIYRERTSHHAHDEQDRINIAALLVDMEKGISTTVIRNSTLSAAAVEGDTSVTTVGTTAVTAGQTLALTLESGRIQLLTLSANSATSTLTFTEGLLEPASAGAVAVVYADDACTLEVSRDGGQTWGTPRTLHMGVATTKDLRVISRRWGQGRNWTVRFKTSAAVKVVIRGLIAKLWGEA